MKRRKQHPSTLSVHAGERESKIGDAVATPIFQTATYSFSESAAVRRYHEEKIKSRFEYGRYGSPTQLTLERKLAEIFGTEDALVTSSGMSAVTDAFLSMLSTGDHLVMTAESYRRTRSFCEKYLAKFGVKVTFAKPRAKEIIAAITKKTRAVFVEIPTNPHLYVPDIPAIAKATKSRGIPLLVDPTIAGPFSCDPVAMGADMVILSLTKYLGGHNDVIAGAVLGSRRLIDPVREYHGTAGSVLAPHSVYLVLRGMKTASLRTERQCRSALAIASFLESHPKVREVYYPGLRSHPDHEIAARLMTGFGCIVSFRLRADLKRAEKFLDRLELMRIGPSLGGVESLAELVVTMSFWDKDRATRARLGIPDDLVRFSIGIEDPDDIIDDIERALRAI